MKKYRNLQAWRKASRSNGSRLGSCGGKVGYETKAEAQAVLERMQEQANFRPRPGKVLSVYFCGGCSKWKVGNRPVPVPRVRGGGRRKSA